MAQNMGGDGELAGQFVVISTAVSMFTLFLWIFFMKSGGTDLVENQIKKPSVFWMKLRFIRRRGLFYFVFFLSIQSFLKIPLIR